MSAAINSPVTLLPAAFGILVLQKAYGVARASVTPRLLPAEITLVTANARSQLMALTASMLGGAVAAGIETTVGAAWVLRAGTLIYLAAMFLALRLPDQVDSPARPLPHRPAVPLRSLIFHRTSVGAPPAHPRADRGRPSRGDRRARSPTSDRTAANHRPCRPEDDPRLPIPSGPRNLTRKPRKPRPLPAHGRPPALAGGGP